MKPSCARLIPVVRGGADVPAVFGGAIVTEQIFLPASAR
jgi:hypothetical protein